MSEFAMFATMLLEIRGWLQHRAHSRTSGRERFNDVIAAVKRAANHTRSYIAQIRDNPASRNRETERGLSDKWVEVGTSLQRIGDDSAHHLYERCFLKAEYWSDPSRWTDDDIEKADIELEIVLKDVEESVDA